MNWIIFFVVLFFSIVLLYVLYQVIRYLRTPKKFIPISTFKCIDGHFVKSKGELIIDNYLYIQGIKHFYEKTIKVKGLPIKYDWYLPDIELYIEYWGYHGKEYEERKEEKIKLYKKGKLELLSIENEMFDDIYKNLDEKIGKFIDLKESYNKVQFCPNCGFNLDDRFEKKLKSKNI